MAAAGPEAWLRREKGVGVAKKALVGSSGWSSAYTYFMEDGTSFFVKESQGRGPAMFAGEAAGLRAMGAAGTSLKVPEVFEVGELDRGPPGSGGGSFIVMEHLEMSGRTDQAALGRALAEMHLAEPTAPEAKAGQFGFPVSACCRRAKRSGGLTQKKVNNTIGGTPQPNPWTDNWVEFFRDHRLGHQLKLAGDERLSRMAAPVLESLDKFFAGVDVKPSILHGDLWSGNIAAAGGRPTIFDPASYYGHHEAEFGMQWCAVSTCCRRAKRSGGLTKKKGFGGNFWDAYHALIPKAPGFEVRAPTGHKSTTLPDISELRA